MDSSTLRLVWSVVEETRSSELLELTDTAMVKRIVQHINDKILLSGEQACAVSHYVSSKTMLIRDIAESPPALS
jgi:GR25 family glycosyltransferase involved in LPS biosynthesis